MPGTIYTIINGGSAIAGVNAGGVGVDEYTYKDGVGMSSTELTRLLDGVTYHKNIAVLFDLSGFADKEALKRVLAISSMYQST